MVIQVCHYLVAPATEELCIVVDGDEVFYGTDSLETVANEAARIFHYATVYGDIPMVKLCADVHIMDEPDGTPHCYSDLNSREQTLFHGYFLESLQEIRRDWKQGTKKLARLIEESGGC
jgi:hypothetical protein